MWLPLHLHGTAAFRGALDEKLDLAAHVHRELVRTPGLDVPLVPDLTVSVFRSTVGDAATGRLLADVNAGRRVFLSSTRLRGRDTVRLCVLSHRTGRDRVDEAIAAIRAATSR